MLRPLNFIVYADLVLKEIQPQGISSRVIASSMKTLSNVDIAPKIAGILDTCEQIIDVGETKVNVWCTTIILCYL